MLRKLIVFVSCIVAILTLEVLMYIDGYKKLKGFYGGGLVGEEGSPEEMRQRNKDRKTNLVRGLGSPNNVVEEEVDEPVSPVQDYFNMLYKGNEEYLKSSETEEISEGRIKSVGIYKESLGSDYVDTNPDKFASELASDLRKFGLRNEAVAGIIGSLDYESLGFTRYKEIKGPGVSAAQYTNMRGVDETKRKEFIRDRDYAGLVKIGARKDAFLAHSQDKGLDPRSYEAFRDFMFYEFKNTGEKSILNKLDKAKNPEQAAVIFTKSFLRPAEKTANLNKRKSNAREYYSTYN